jgi:hypothetical protein
VLEQKKHVSYTNAVYFYQKQKTAATYFEKQGAYHWNKRKLNENQTSKY